MVFAPKKTLNPVNPRLAAFVERTRSAGERVFLRNVVARDRQRLLRLTQSSTRLHQPWIETPTNSALFNRYLERIRTRSASGTAVCFKHNDEIVGIINLNEIVLGAFRSARISYYIDQEHQGQGLMTEGMTLFTQDAFHSLGLHRIEAAIQPLNVQSKRLVSRCGYHYEGLSQGYLFINGQWRDHERWAIVHNRTTLGTN